MRIGSSDIHLQSSILYPQLRTIGSDAGRVRSRRRGQDCRGDPLPAHRSAAGAVRALAARLAAEERLAIIRAYVGERGSRFQRPGRAFEEPYYTFDMLADLGAYRDLQRHRILTQERQRYTVRHGYVTPRRAGGGRAGANLRAGARARRRGGRDDRRRSARAGAVRRADGVSRALAHQAELARGLPPGRAALGAAGPPDLPADRPGDLRADSARFTRRWPRACALSIWATTQLERLDAERRLDAKLQGRVN